MAVVEMAYKGDAILTEKNIDKMSEQELEALLLDLSGRLELDVEEVDLFYQVEEELKRRKQNDAG